MRRLTVPQLVVLAVVVGACSVPRTGAPSADASAQGSFAHAMPLPSGFPVMPGAVAVPMPADDPGLIGMWESDRAGSAAYDFYVQALPAAGFPIIGLYPGGGVALIRFRVEGEVWQMVTQGTAEGRVAIEIRLDRP